MELLRIFTFLYGQLYNRHNIPYWLITPFRILIRETANLVLPIYLKRINRKGKNENIIVSLTTFPDRADTVWQVIQCLKKQTVLPKKIILWLSKNQFPNEINVPKTLLSIQDEIFEIRYVEGDIRSHKKYYYVFKEYPNDIIVTCDDDIYYHPDMLSSLIEAHKLYPNDIIANTTAKIIWNKEGTLLPYSQWERSFNAYNSDDNVQIGIGGVLYPPRCLCHLTCNVDLFMNLAPKADDLWLNLMARLKGTAIIQSPLHILPLPIKNHSSSLSSVNNGPGNLNDLQLSQLRKWLVSKGFKDVYSKA